jgi:hypothetical protein
MQIDEADLLRTAAAIKSLLSDGQLHPWRDCTDLARDHTGGNWRQAADLAFKALTQLIDAPCVWAGDKGTRLIALVQPGAVDGVPCPTCSAPAGQACVKVNSAGKTPKAWPHEARERAAVGADAALATR